MGHDNLYARLRVLCKRCLFVSSFVYMNVIKVFIDFTLFLLRYIQANVAWALSKIEVKLLQRDAQKYDHF